MVLKIIVHLFLLTTVSLLSRLACSAAEPPPDWIHIPELRAYVEGKPAYRIRSVGVAALVYLSREEAGYHRDLAASAERLNNDTIVVPLVELASGKTAGLLRVANCQGPDRRISDHASGALFLSLGKGGERGCAAVHTNGLAAARFVELLLTLERSGCLTREMFHVPLFETLWSNPGQFDGKNISVLHDLFVHKQKICGQ